MPSNRMLQQPLCCVISPNLVASGSVNTSYVIVVKLYLRQKCSRKIHIPVFGLALRLFMTVYTPQLSLSPTNFRRKLHDPRPDESSFKRCIVQRQSECLKVCCCAFLPDSYTQTPCSDRLYCMLQVRWQSILDTRTQHSPHLTLIFTGGQKV